MTSIKCQTPRAELATRAPFLVGIALAAAITFASPMRSWADVPAPTPPVDPHIDANGVYQTPQTPYQPSRFPAAAQRLYADVWGIDSLSVRLMESGELIRFTYRVLSPSRAAPLLDKRLTPSLIDETRGVSLVVPEMESIGMLRQTAAPKENRQYWVAFSNKGRAVKRGDRVNVVIGPFHANNLVVD